MDENTLQMEIESTASQIIVNSAESYAEAGKALLTINDLLNKVKSYWKPLKEKAHEAHKAITARENEMIKPIEARKKEISIKVSTYLTEQDQIKREEQRRMDAERQAQEKIERERLERESAAAEENWDLKKAVELKAQAESVYIPPTIVQSEIKKTVSLDEGTMSAKKDIEVEIVNIIDVLRHIISGKLPINLIAVNESKLKQFLKMSGIMELSGCQIREVINAQVRRAK